MEATPDNTHTCTHGQQQTHGQLTNTAHQTQHNTAQQSPRNFSQTLSVLSQYSANKVNIEIGIGIEINY